MLCCTLTTTPTSWLVSKDADIVADTLSLATLWCQFRLDFSFLTCIISTSLPTYCTWEKIVTSAGVYRKMDIVLVRHLSGALKKKKRELEETIIFSIVLTNFSGNSTFAW